MHPMLLHSNLEKCAFILIKLAQLYRTAFGNPLPLLFYPSAYMTTNNKVSLYRKYFVMEISLYGRYIWIVTLFE